MLKLMLIDDEYLILKGIEAMLGHQDDVALEIMPYLDSVVALEALNDLRPDAVVLDVNMPELDGLAFIERALERGFSGSFIIVSGYEDAAYLRRAFELHVADYIIKPISKRKLIDALCRLDERKAQAQQALLTSLRFRLILAHDLSRARDGAADWERFHSAPYWALACLRRLPGEERTRAVVQRLGEYFQPVYPLNYDLGDAILCALPHAIRPDELMRILQSCGVQPEDAPGLSHVASRRELTDTLAQDRPLTLLMEAVADSILRELKLTREIPSAAALDFAVARRIIQNADAHQISAAYQAVFLGASDRADGYARAFVDGMTGLLIRYGYQTQPGQLGKLYQRMWGDVADAAAPHARMAELPEQVLHALSFAEPTRGRYSEKIEDALQFMRLHFPEDFSLNDVAQSVGLSPSYFSASFSREVGVSFVAYLKQIRLDEACRLLQAHPQLSVETVAARVGYQTVGQFYRVFKSVYHESPKSWRGHRSASEPERPRARTAP